MTETEAIKRIEALIYDSVIDNEQLIEAIKAILKGIKK